MYRSVPQLLHPYALLGDSASRLGRVDIAHEALLGRIFDIQFGVLIADLEGQARHILDYCNLEWGPVCFEFYKNKKAEATAIGNQVRQPIYISSMRQKERYGELINPKLDALDPVL